MRRAIAALFGVQQLGQRRLGATGVMAQRVDQVDLRRANALFPQGKQYQLLCLAGNLVICVREYP